MVDTRPHGVRPPLPFADESFDLVYAVSVFTGLEETDQLVWMNELARVVRPDGAIIVTFHGRSGIEYLHGHPLHDEVAPSFEAGRLASLRPAPARDAPLATYHPEGYVRNVLAGDLDVVDYSPGGALDVKQDAVLFRRPAR